MQNNIFSFIGNGKQSPGHKGSISRFAKLPNSLTDNDNVQIRAHISQRRVYSICLMISLAFDHRVVVNLVAFLLQLEHTGQVLHIRLEIRPCFGRFGGADGRLYFRAVEEPLDGARRLGTPHHTRVLARSLTLRPEVDDLALLAPVIN